MSGLPEAGLTLNTGDPPLAEQILGVGIRRGKQTLDLNPGVDDLGEMDELTAVHFLAGVFTETVFEPA